VNIGAVAHLESSRAAIRDEGVLEIYRDERERFLGGLIRSL
jgi:hypothetical protein